MHTFKLRGFTVTKVQKLEKEIKALSEKEFAELRNWFLELDSDKWDEQIERDAKSGKLDALANQALKDFENGNYKEL